MLHVQFTLNNTSPLAKANNNNAGILKVRNVFLYCII